jgi:tetratricopeptide (TPR) repeat protein
MARLRPEDFLYAGLVLVLVLPIWTVAYFPTQDGPMHLHNARILLDHLRGNGQAYDAYYAPNLTLFPYWFSHLALASLLTLFSPVVAEKLLLTAYIVLAAVLVRLIVRTLRPEAGFLAFLALPLICSQPFQMGFLSFCFGSVFLLLVVLYWLRCEAELTHIRLLVLSGWFLVLYFSHPVPYLLAGATVACLIVAGRTALLSRFAALAVAALPSFLLLLVYLLSAPSYRAEPLVSYAALAGNFARQSAVVLMTGLERPLAMAIGAVFLVLVILTVRRRLAEGVVIQRGDGFLIAAAIGVVVHLYGARNLIGFFERTQTFPLLMLIAWFSTRAYAAVEKRVVIAASAVIVIGLVLLRWPVYAQASDHIEEFLTVADAIPPRATVLPLTFAQAGLTPEGQPIVDYPLLLHTPDYLGADDKQIVMLDNIGGLYPMFPYLWRGNRNPYSYIQQNGGMESVPPEVVFADYRERTGGTVDYIVTSGFVQGFEQHPGGRAIRQQLDAVYERVAASPNGFAVVYRRRGTEPFVRQAEASVADLLNASLQLYREGRFEDSIVAAETATRLDPRSDGAYNNICAANNELGRWDRAIDACQKAIAINPANTLARNNLDWATRRKAGTPP